MCWRFDCYRIIDKSLGEVLFRFFCLKKIFTKRPKLPGLKKPVEKILLIKLWGIGNLALIYPLVYKIREKYPHSTIFFFTFDLNRGFLERNKAIDAVIYFSFTRNIFKIILKSIFFLRCFRKEKIDLVINFETFNNASALFAYLVRAFIRIGINNKYEKIFYHYWLDNNPSLHISKIFSGLLNPLGINSCYSYFCFEKSDKDRDRIENLLASLKINRFICIHPGTSDNFKGKRWGAEEFAALSNMLLNMHDLTLIFTGQEREKDLVKNIIQKIGVKDKACDLSDFLNIWDFAELLRRSFLFISNDTGPLHIAASLGVNIAVFYGPTSPRKYAPLNKNSLIFYKNFECSPCIGTAYLNNKCGDNFKCLDFTPQEVFISISEKFFDEKYKFN